MASKEGYKLLKKTDGEGNYGSISILGNRRQSEFEEELYELTMFKGSSTETQVGDKNDKNGDVTTPCPAVLESSKDESLRSEGRPKTDARTHSTRSCPRIPTDEASTNSRGESNDHLEEQQSSGDANEWQIISTQQRNNEEDTEEPRSCCAAFRRSYRSYARRIGRSWFMYIFQLFLGLLSVSAIVMGIRNFGSCVDADNQTFPIDLMSILMSVPALVFIYLWWRKIHRHRSGLLYSDRERGALFGAFVIFLALSMTEIMFFAHLTEETAQSEPVVKCPTIYYDFLYSLNIVMVISFAFGASIYLPDCCIDWFTHPPPVTSQTNGQNQEPL